MRDRRFRFLPRRVWLAAALVPMLSGCVGAAVIPMLISGPLLRTKHVKAATPVPHAAAEGHAKRAKPKRAQAAGKNPPQFVVTKLKELPPPSPAAPSPDDPWQKFFTYALASETPPGASGKGRSALLVADPPLDTPSRRDCAAQVPAVIVDLDDGSTTFDPQQLPKAPADIAAGFARLRQAGVVVLWISQLPAARAADVAQALRTSGLDPRGEDQLLLRRSHDDRKQLLRNDANDDVCIVAIAGDGRDDFDELFDYLRHPEQAFGLDAMLGKGWFLVPPLDAPAAVPK